MDRREPSGGPQTVAATLDLDLSPEALAAVTTVLRGPRASVADDEPETSTFPVVRYVVDRELGRGGVAVVQRVHDRDLGRSLARKTLRRELVGRPDVRARLLDEARVMAQLEHPGILPVHDLDRDEDGRLAVLMQEVHGDTLAERIEVLHQASPSPDRFDTPADGWGLRRLLDALLRVAEAVGYAHHRGVVHRDLKPANVMVGRHGRVLVLDWGLAKVVGVAAQPVTTTREGSALDTHMGAVLGTPAFMAPEQARGELADVGPPADVYALGGILYQLLTGELPRQGPVPRVVARAVTGERPPPPGLPRVAPGLRSLIERCLAPEPADRPADGQAVADALRRWLDGEERDAEARALVVEAEALQRQAEALRDDAARAEAEAGASLSGVAPWAPVEAKRHGWQQQDAAQRLAAEARQTERSAAQRAHEALRRAGDHPAAHQFLADQHQRAFVRAEARHDERAMEEHLAGVARHDRGRWGRWARGEAVLSLATDAAGTEVVARRYEARDRRLVLGEPVALGRAPLDRAPLSHGSWRLTLTAPGRAPVHLPLAVGRDDHVQIVRPDGSPHVVHLPAADALGPDDVFVPAGWFRSGGDAGAFNSLPGRRLWIGDRVVRRFPVTHAEYIRFLDDLVDQGREAEALRHAPRERQGADDDLGPLLYARDADGHFGVATDADGDRWALDWPVLLVDWHGAMAYARWEAARTGQPWRLPGELEWEKAARGVDGRRYPWGHHLDPTFCCTWTSRPGRSLPESVHRYPVDCSPYGVRGMAGNIRDWCAEAWAEQGPPVAADGVVGEPVQPADDDPAPRVFRGGSWWFVPELARCASRELFHPSFRIGFLGFRLARTLTAPPEA